MKLPRFALAGVIALTLAGCSQYATVSRSEPQFQPRVTSSTSLAGAEQKILEAQRIEKKEPRKAIGEYLAAAQEASQRIARNSSDLAARDTYNFAVARIVATIQENKLAPWKQPLSVSSTSGDFTLTHRPDRLGRKEWNPALYDFAPADEFDVKGSYVIKRERKEGIGAPIVAIARETNAAAAKDFTPHKLFYCVTAVIHFNGKHASLAMEDPFAAEDVTFAGRKMPLAADYTVPLAVMLTQQNLRRFEIGRLLNPEKYAETARIARLQPYDPNKTVVLVIHGLMDSPATWVPMINHLRANEEIRKNYQFWFYSYPSGYPYPHSAAILRRELDAVQKRFPLRKKMVVIGHSMGGCISRLLLTDTGDDLWTALFKKRPDETQISGDSRKLLTEALIFKHRPEVGRVIFIAAPLRGAEMASNWIGRLGSMLVKSPSSLMHVGSDALKAITFQADELQMSRLPNSVDTLATNNRFVKAIQQFPLAPGIPYHVISGDRGKGGNRDKTKPICSDGLVPYWSSHLDGAQSELVVPSNHSAHQAPQTITEVARILNLHSK